MCQLRTPPCRENSLLAWSIPSGLCAIWAAWRGQPENLLSKLTQWITQMTDNTATEKLQVKHDITTQRMCHKCEERLSLPYDFSYSTSRAIKTITRICNSPQVPEALISPLEFELCLAVKTTVKGLVRKNWTHRKQVSVLIGIRKSMWDPASNQSFEKSSKESRGKGKN